MRLYYEFLNWILPKFTSLNDYFQSDKVLILNRDDKIKDTYRDILLCYMKGEYITSRALSDVDPLNESYFCNKASLYLGTAVMQLLDTETVTKHPALLEDFYKHVFQFLSTGCYEIKKRYDFSDKNVISKLNVFLPHKALSKETHTNFPTLRPYLREFTRMSDKIDWQCIHDEWRKLPFFQFDFNDKFNETTHPDVFWGHIYNYKNDDNGDFLFKNLAQFVLNLLCLPHSNAECERIFSKVYSIKTKSRNRLLTDTIEGIVLSKQHVGVTECTKFEPNDTMLNMITKNMYNFKKIHITDNTSENTDSDEEEIVFL